MTLGFFIVVIVISEFAALNKVLRPYLWPDDYSFMRMSRLVAAERLPNYQLLDSFGGKFFSDVFINSLRK